MGLSPDVEGRLAGAGAPRTQSSGRLAQDAGQTSPTEAVDSTRSSAARILSRRARPIILRPDVQGESVSYYSKFCAIKGWRYIRNKNCTIILKFNCIEIRNESVVLLSDINDYYYYMRTLCVYALEH